MLAIPVLLGLLQSTEDRGAYAMTETAGINPALPPSGTGCVDCLSDDGWWFHLRRCAECGHIGCCDTSPSQHATAHAHASRHPWITSFEPGEDWWWNYDEDAFYEGGPAIAPPTSHPAEQPAPGPPGRVPADWQDHLH
jgi:hypothetical protein